MTSGETSKLLAAARANGWLMLYTVSLLAAKGGHGTDSLGRYDRVVAELSLQIASQHIPLTTMPACKVVAPPGGRGFSPSVDVAIHQMRKLHWERAERGADTTAKLADTLMAHYLTHVLENEVLYEEHAQRVRVKRHASARKLMADFPPPVRERKRTDITLSELFAAYA